MISSKIEFQKVPYCRLPRIARRKIYNRRRYLIRLARNEGYYLNTITKTFEILTGENEFFLIYWAVAELMQVHGYALTWKIADPNIDA